VEKPGKIPMSYCVCFSEFFHQKKGPDSPGFSEKWGWKIPLILHFCEFINFFPSDRAVVGEMREASSIA
jgi:hypothetical protein